MMNFFKHKYVGKHYKMERFILMFCTFIFLMMSVLLWGWIVKMNRDKNVISDEALYNIDFTTSKSFTKGHVVDVFTNDDKTRAFLLLKLDRLDNFSTDALNYQAFMTSANVSQNPSEYKAPAGIIYSFGSTGYIGVYLTNHLGFDKQIMKLTMRLNSELSGEKKRKGEYNDKTYDEFDQFDVYFNPGAKNASIMECLNNEGAPTYTQLYNQGVIEPIEELLRLKAYDEIERMRISLNIIGEYKDRLSTTHQIILPDDPKEIKGDKVFGSKESGDLRLLSEYVYARGFSYDWQNSTISRGYLDKLLSKDDTSYEAFFARKNAESDIRHDEFRKYKWQLIDGTYLEDLNIGVSSGNDRYTRINNDIQKLLNAYDEYKAIKSVYQTSTLRDFLVLELDLKNIDKTVTVNSEKDALICY